MGKKNDSEAAIRALLGGIQSAAGQEQRPRVSLEECNRMQKVLADKVRVSAQFEVGDKIQRNEIGRNKYKAPYDGQYAIIRHIFPEYQQCSEESFACNAVVAIVISDTMAGHAVVDLAMFEPFKE